MNQWFVCSDSEAPEPHIVPFVHLQDAVNYLNALNDIQFAGPQTLLDWYITDSRGVPVEVSPDLDVIPCPMWLGVPVDVSGWLP